MCVCVWAAGDLPTQISLASYWICNEKTKTPEKSHLRIVVLFSFLPFSMLMLLVFLGCLEFVVFSGRQVLHCDGGHERDSSPIGCTHNRTTDRPRITTTKPQKEEEFPSYFSFLSKQCTGSTTSSTWEVKKVFCLCDVRK